MDTTPTIKGIARHKRRLRAMPHAVAQEGAKAEAQNAIEHRDAAKSLAPERTGELDDTIQAYPVRGTAGTVWRVVAGVRNGGRAFYARFQEFGTRAQEGSPFFFVAYRRFRARFRRRRSRAMSTAAKKVFGNGS